MTKSPCLHLAAALAALNVCMAAASAQTPMPSLEGDYSLVSSSTAPVSKWGYAKGRISIKKLDDKHISILLGCGWKDEPKAVCSDQYYAQWHDGGLFLQDMNTDLERWYFDPAAHTITVISRGLDARETVRRDVYKATGIPLTDPALIRRMKRKQAAVDDKESLRVFGHYSKWKYLNNRIEFQHP
jgi:hypothetical protein